MAAGVSQQTSRDAVHDDLAVQLDTPLPARLPVGRATAIFCCGACFHPRQRIARLELELDGVRHRPTAFAMPRPDLFRQLHPALTPEQERSADRDPGSERDPELRSYRSGFWATIPIEPHDAPGTIELRAEVRLADGRRASAPLGAIEVVKPERPPVHAAAPQRGGEAPIAICMATFDPDPELFRRQIDSLRAQTHSGWICVVSDDHSHPDRFDAIEQILASDPRFVVSRSDARQGFYKNFERALEMVPAEAELVALCDQDDRWYPQKLEVLRGALGEAQLVYCDQRLVDRDGRVLRETLWKGRRNNHTNLASQLLANTIVGAASLFRRRLVDLALPFPEGPGWQFHDHWLGVVALATGGVTYVDRPLYDYVQHAEAVVGKEAVERGARGRRRFGLRGRRGLLTRWRATYFRSYVPLELQAHVVLARCSARLTARKRRALRLLIAAGRSPLGFAWLAARPLRALVGRNETLGTEAHLTRGILWRALIRIRTRGRQRPGRSAPDASIPPFDVESFGQRRLKRWLARA